MYKYVESSHIVWGRTGTLPAEDAIGRETTND
jgi:hypothetical protein